MGVIFCSYKGEWKEELEKRLQTDEKDTLTVFRRQPVALISLTEEEIKGRNVKFKPELTTLEACSPPIPKGRAEREQKRRNEEWKNRKVVANG
jgi:hypothetical protein